MSVNPDYSCDVLIVGGGVNGCGIARDAAGRGLRVLLCEQDDLAAHTSSASTKLIHGGLRYLEDFHFALVRKALREREVLLAAAPHIIRPLHFVMPHDAHLRPAWMIRAGLFLYDHLAPRRQLEASRAVDLRHHVAGAPLQTSYHRGFIYSDGWVDDARLVVLNAVDARERGARILTQVRCASLAPAAGGGWQAELQGPGGTQRVQARAVVNASGPWVSSFISAATPVRAVRHVRLVKGSHIVVPRLFEHPFAYIFQNEDRRIVFAIPYEQEFTLLGTTDLDYQGDPAQVHIDAAEVSYLCALANRYFRQQIEPADVVRTFSGVRPLLADDARDPMSVTRDYALELDTVPAPLLSVFGGKITTYRRLAEDALERLAEVLPVPTRRWTAQAPLPGGDLPGGSMVQFLRELEHRHPWLPAALRTRYAHAYGTRLERLLGGAENLGALGSEVLPYLYERELEYLVREEFAHSSEDILWRRSKLGLHLGRADVTPLDRWLGEHSTALRPTAHLSAGVA
ncbi:MAG: glycerol-3-phosphate dehydrogenase [Gammaproteobacteria bacterium]|nr:glycerol-3-phosphate dehydrogenase [Gammaproteobacteria bacterium]MBV9695782.1 glycerol-3-phosphate dehydrogenase [Gammaproteobacteria bacterium]